MNFQLLIFFIIVTASWSLCAQNDVSVKANAHLEWLKRNGIELNSLAKADPAELIYACDSVLLRKRVRGDTTIFWTVSSTTYLDTTRAKEYIEFADFGLTDYISGVNYQGNIAYVSLSPRTFYVRNDSLFELETFYTISEDSVLALYGQFFNMAMDSTLSEDSLEALLETTGNSIKTNQYQKYKLIFHPDIFKEWVYDGNINGDRIELASVWNVEGKKYYQIFIKNRLDDTPTKYAYRFDEDYKFLDFDDCSEQEKSILTKDTRVGGYE